MKKTFKILAYGVGGLFFLLLIAGVLLHLFFPKQYVIDKATASISESMGQPVTIQDLDLDLFPMPGISLEGLEIGKEVSAGKPHIKLQALVLRVRPMPLFAKKLQVAALELIKPEIEMMLGGEEAKEITPAPKKTTSGTDTSDYSLTVESFRIKDASINILTEKGKPFVTLSGIDESLSASATGEGDVSLEGTLKIQEMLAYLPGGKLGQGLTLQLEKKLSYQKSSDRLTIAKADLRLGDLPLALKGQIDKSTSDKPTADLSLSGGPTDIKNIMGYLPAGMFPEVDGIKSQGILSLHASVKGPLKDPKGPIIGLLDYAFALKLKNGRIVHPKLGAPVSDIQIDLTVTPKLAHLKRFHAKTKKSSIDVSARATNYLKDPFVKANVSASVDVAEAIALQPQKSPITASGQAHFTMKASGKPSHPEKMDLSGRVQMINVTATGKDLPVPVKKLNVDLSLTKNSGRLKNLSATLGKSDIRLSGSLTNATALYMPNKEKEAVGVTLNLKSSVLDLDELLLNMPATEETSESAPLPPLITQLKGNVDLGVKRLRVNKLDVTNVRGVAILNRGLLTIKRFSLNAFEGGMKLNGKIDARNLKNPSFDLDADLKRVGISPLLTYATNIDRLVRVSKYLSAKMDGKAKLKGDLKNGSDLNMKTFSSNGEIKLYNTNLTNHPIQKGLAGFLSTPSLNSLSINDWLQSFTIKDGKLDLSKLKLKAGGMKLQLSGSQSLDGALDMGINLDLPQKLSKGLKKKIPKQAVPILFDGSKSTIQVPFDVLGQFTSPKIRLNQKEFSAGVKKRTKQKLAAKQKKAEKKLKAKASNEIDKLLAPKAKNPKKKTTKKKSTKTKAKDLLKSLF